MQFKDEKTAIRCLHDTSKVIKTTQSTKAIELLAKNKFGEAYCDTIIREVELAFDIQSIKGNAKRRDGNLVIARAITSYLILKNDGICVTTAAARLGITRNTIYNGAKTVESQIQKNRTGVYAMYLNKILSNFTLD